jgi:putative DNA primase/helicase
VERKEKAAWGIGAPAASKGFLVRDRIQHALTFVDPHDRDTWLRVGMAIKSALGDHGFAIWDAWSQTAENYDARDARDVWKSIRPDGGVTIATLFYEARKRGWRDDAVRILAPEEEAEARRRIEEARRQAEAERKARAEQAAALAATIWKEARPAGEDHPYLLKKGVRPVATLRETTAEALSRRLGYVPQARGEPLEGRVLLAPVRVEGRLATLEMIDEQGRKSALAGGLKRSGYWATGPLPDAGRIVLGEGVATALSIAEALGEPVAAALSVGNLLAAGEAIRDTRPQAELVVAADLDKDGKPHPEAVKAAQALGCRLAVPRFACDPPPGGDFNDMASLHGLEAVRACIEAAQPVEPQQARKTAPWPAPQPLTAKFEPEPYPMDALPDRIRAAVEEVQAFVKAPVPLVASSALAALSLACQAHVDVKRAEKLQGPVSLFLLTIADSGERKTTCDRFFTSRIRQYEQEQAEALRPEMKRYKAELAAWEAEREGILSAIKAAGKSGKPCDRLKSELVELERVKPEPPRVPRLLLGDETPEALAWSLAKLWPSAGVLSSEAATILGAHGMNRDNIMRNLGLLNVLWDGITLSIGRKTSESFTVEGARLTVGLMVQEATLREFLARSGALARGSGFLSRFLVAWPESTQGSRKFTEPPAHWPHLAAFNRRIAEILSQPAPIGEDGALTPAVLSMTPDAKHEWVMFHDAIETELRDGGELYDVRDVAAKAAENAARLAALFQVFEFGINEINLDSFERASRIVAWHLSEARRFFGEFALPSELADAARLDTWLVEYCRRERTHIVGKSTALQYGPLRRKDSLDAAIRELAELDRLQVRKDGKRTILAINPELLGFANAKAANPAKDGDARP